MLGSTRKLRSFPRSSMALSSCEAPAVEKRTRAGLRAKSTAVYDDMSVRHSPVVRGMAMYTRLM